MNLSTIEDIIKKSAIYSSCNRIALVVLIKIATVCQQLTWKMVKSLPVTAQNRCREFFFVVP